jgi:hypothetical protein
MINSGLNVPIPEIPIPAFEVPNAAPTAAEAQGKFPSGPSFAGSEANELTAEHHLREDVVGSATARKRNQRNSLTAEATPANPKKGAYGGQVDMVGQSLCG